eukprot:4109115-Amphidinium_carterae.2
MSLCARVLHDRYNVRGCAPEGVCNSMYVTTMIQISVLSTANFQDKPHYPQESGVTSNMQKSTQLLIHVSTSQSGVSIMIPERPALDHPLKTMILEKYHSNKIHCGSKGSLQNIKTA